MSTYFERGQEVQVPWKSFNTNRWPVDLDLYLDALEVTELTETVASILRALFLTSLIMLTSRFESV
jgi:hypothetical protein